MEEELEFTLDPQFESVEELEEVNELPDVDLDPESIDKIKRLFDSGCTRSTIAKELGIDREDVIEVLSKYVGRNKINGHQNQEVIVRNTIEGKIRVPLGDRANTIIYVKEGANIEAAKEKWLKVLGM